MIWLFLVTYWVVLQQGLFVHFLLKITATLPTAFAEREYITVEPVEPVRDTSPTRVRDSQASDLDHSHLPFNNLNFANDAHGLYVSCHQSDALPQFESRCFTPGRGLDTGFRRMETPVACLLHLPIPTSPWQPYTIANTEGCSIESFTEKLIAIAENTFQKASLVNALLTPFGVTATAEKLYVREGKRKNEQKSLQQLKIWIISESNGPNAEKLSELCAETRGKPLSLKSTVEPLSERSGMLLEKYQERNHQQAFIISL